MFTDAASNNKSVVSHPSLNLASTKPTYLSLCAYTIKMQINYFVSGSSDNAEYHYNKQNTI